MDIIVTDQGLAVDLTLNLPHALHSRPSAKLAQCARQFQADIRLISENGEADARSMLDILSLALPPHARLRLLASGSDAEDALKTLYAMLTSDKE